MNFGSYYMEDDMIVVDEVEYCITKSKIKGLIMCLGLVITKPMSEGVILSHYITGEDQSESHKLDKIQNIMNDKKWYWKDGVKVVVYKLSNNAYMEQQKESIRIIQDRLRIPSYTNLSVINVKKGNLSFDESGNLFA